MSSPSDKQNSLGLFASSIPSSTYLNDPFEPVPASSNSESDDEDTVEPIDEQEIYGKLIIQFGVYFHSQIFRLICPYRPHLHHLRS